MQQRAATGAKRLDDSHSGGAVDLRRWREPSVGAAKVEATQRHVILFPTGEQRAFFDIGFKHRRGREMGARRRERDAAARLFRRDDNIDNGPVKQRLGDGKRGELGLRAGGCQDHLRAGNGEVRGDLVADVVEPVGQFDLALPQRHESVLRGGVTALSDGARRR